LASDAASTGSVESRLRLWLLLLVAAVYPGTVVELVLEKHYDKLLQFIPFALCIAGFLTVALVILYARKLTIWLMRAVMFVTMPATLFGMWEHLDGNLDFQREIRANADTWEQLTYAIHGAAPLLAPGILALAAGVALIATYGHPALQAARRA
jgi:hypothetical protein